MLEKIYLITEKSDKFVNLYKNIISQCTDSKKVQVAIISAQTAVAIYNKEHKNSLFVSEKDINGLSEIVGYGIEYRGNSSYVIADDEVSLRYLRLIYARLRRIPYVVAMDEHIVIREMKVEDTESINKTYESNIDCPYISQPSGNISEQKEENARYIKNMYGFFQYGLWVVCDTKTGDIIGRVGLENIDINGENCVELGYMIKKNWQRRGIAYRACMLIMEYCRNELYLKKIYIRTDKKNIPSVKLAEKLGFVLSKNTEGYNIYEKIIQ